MHKPAKLKKLLLRFKKGRSSLWMKLAPESVVLTYNNSGEIRWKTRVTKQTHGFIMFIMLWIDPADLGFINEIIRHHFICLLHRDIVNGNCLQQLAQAIVCRQSLVINLNPRAYFRQKAIRWERWPLVQAKHFTLVSHVLLYKTRF